MARSQDFRYSRAEEWTQQYENLNRLFNHINAHKGQYNMNARFGTLKDYFDLLLEKVAKEPDTSQRQLPTLSGDFFTYADRDDHYWSGYFTSTHFHKHLDRTLQHYLRAADILFTAAVQRRSGGELTKDATRNSSEEDHGLFALYPHLVVARRALSLFQHHDGVSGTAKDFVMEDYGMKWVFVGGVG